MNEDTLILYYFNDGLSDRERRQVETAISTDTAVSAQYKALCRQLNDCRETDDQAVPAHTLRRWHDSIDRAARQDQPSQQRPAGTFNFFSFAWGAAITAALAIGIGIGMYMAGGDTNTPMIEVANVGPSAGNVVPASFTRGVRVHLQDAQQGLADLSLDTDADRIMLVLRKRYALNWHSNSR
jgi:anti-sigma-K factor RskA